jgi:3-phenylpropionate/cinnamic acid dioxygenase small subunit
MDLHELSNRHEINDLLIRYSEALNRADWDTWSACFTDDAHVDYRTAGGVAGTVAEAVAWLSPTMAMFDMRIHRMANVQISFDGADRAAVCSQYSTLMRFPVPADARAKPTFVEAAGWYDDVVVRTATGWLLSTRAERIAYTRI